MERLNRIQKRFQKLRAQNRKALIVYLTAGEPSLKQNRDLVCAFEKEGVDLVELGVPFSDPLADGPIIQEASQRALRRGVNLVKIFGLVRDIRQKSQIPILLMSYLNPIFQYGVSRFAKEAQRCGVDGVIIPDLPPEEGREIQKTCQAHRVALVYLLAPTTDSRRRRKILSSSKGFVYYVSLKGVTGPRSVLPAPLYRTVQQLRRKSRLPICVGFGISKPTQARQVAQVSDGVIIGSAIVRELLRHPRLKPADFARRFIRPFARALSLQRGSPR